MGMIEKLNYLNETKQLIRNKIDPNGSAITDTTPFRDYVDLIGGSSGDGITINPKWSTGPFFANGMTGLTAAKRVAANSLVNGTTPDIISANPNDLDYHTIYVYSKIDAIEEKSLQYAASSFIYCHPYYNNFSWVKRLILRDVSYIGAHGIVSALTTLDIGYIHRNDSTSNDSMVIATGAFQTTVTNLVIRTSDAMLGGTLYRPPTNIYVYTKDYTYYTTNTPWSQYKSRIKKIEDYPDICVDSSLFSD